jgi:hypothetical protein
MSNKPQTEEHKQAIDLLYRFRSFRGRKEHPCCLAFLVISFVIISQLERLGVFTVILIAFLWWFFFWIGIMMQRHLPTFFAHRLTPNEYALLATLSEDVLDDAEKGYANQLLEAYKKINPEKEYLRASSPTHNDGTLLRAATQSHDIPQEELLRASHTSET